MDANIFDPEAPIHLPQRHNHDGCSEGKDDCLIVTRTEVGWKWFCHRCKLKGFKPVKGLSPEDTLKFIKAGEVVEEKQTSSISLPDDFSLSISEDGLLWLYKYITDDDIYYYKIGYSAALNRVIFPVYSGTTLVCWQGRYLGEPSKYYPKWNTHKLSGSRHYYFKVVDKVVDTTTVVVVEDMLSAIKVGKYSNCYALLGSYIPDDLMYILSKEYNKVIIWLDADMLKAATKFRNKFQMLGVDCKICFTELDPKGYSLAEIERRVT